MGYEYGGGPDLLGDDRERGVPGVARGDLLGGPAGTPPVGADISIHDADGYRESSAEPRDVGRVRPRGDSAQPVVDVNDMYENAESLSYGVASYQQGNGIRPTGDADEQAPVPGREITIDQEAMDVPLEGVEGGRHPRAYRGGAAGSTAS